MRRRPLHSKCEPAWGQSARSGDKARADSCIIDTYATGNAKPAKFPRAKINSAVTSSFRTQLISGVSLRSRQFCCKPQMAAALANSRTSRLCVHPFDPLSAECGSHKLIRKVLCFPRNLVALELHDAHGVGRLAVVCQDEFGDPKLTTANDSSDRKPLFGRLTGALVLYVGSS